MPDEILETNLALKSVQFTSPEWVLIIDGLERSYLLSLSIRGVITMLALVFLSSVPQSLDLLSDNAFGGS